MEAAFITTILAFIYFLPLIFAASEKRTNTGAIGMLNLLLGWTLIGWVVALVWAMTKSPK